MPFADFQNMLDPDTYARGMPYDELARIRKSGPIHYMEDPTMVFLLAGHGAGGDRLHFQATDIVLQRSARPWRKSSATRKSKPYTAT